MVVMGFRALGGWSTGGGERDVRWGGVCEGRVCLCVRDGDERRRWKGRG